VLSILLAALAGVYTHMMVDLNGACAAVHPQDSATNSFTVSIGDEFKIALSSNPSTGYKWELAEPLNEGVIHLVGSEYRNSTNPMVVGAPGEEVWTFRAVALGRAMINLQYVRPWEKNVAPVKTATYAVEVL
jgi:inhibitor of cysteine peptidase